MKMSTAAPKGSLRKAHALIKHQDIVPPIIPDQYSSNHLIPKHDLGFDFDVKKL